MIPLRPIVITVVVAALASGSPAQVPYFHAAPTPPKVAAKAASQDEVPTSLDGLIQRALADNPEILLADAQLRQAEAELHLARLRIVQAVTEVHAQLRRERAMLDALKDSYARAEKLAQAGNVSSTEVATARAALIEAEVGLVKLESMARLLTGAGGSAVPGFGRSTTTNRGASEAGPSEPARPLFLPTGIVDVLNRPTDFIVEMSLDDVVGAFRSSGVNVILSDAANCDWARPPRAGGSLVVEARRKTKWQLDLAPGTSFKVALSAFCDLTGWVLSYREYGIFIGLAPDCGPRETWIVGPFLSDRPKTGK